METRQIRWLSRDSDGLYMQWRAKPQWRKTREYTGRKFISHSESYFPPFAIILKRGGLAKITIERQY